jgi:hypothetical protein
LPGVARRLSLFCFAKKLSKKGEPAALLFVFLGFCCRAISAAYRASSTSSLLPSIEICITA